MKLTVTLHEWNLVEKILLQFRCQLKLSWNTFATVIVVLHSWQYYNNLLYELKEFNEAHSSGSMNILHEDYLVNILVMKIIYKSSFEQHHDEVIQQFPDANSCPVSWICGVRSCKWLWICANGWELLYASKLFDNVSETVFMNWVPEIKYSSRHNPKPSKYGGHHHSANAIFNFQIFRPLYKDVIE